MAPEITEASLMAAFGLADPGQGAQEQEPADPAAEGTPAEPQTGEQEQEPADPAEDPAEPEDEAEDPADEGSEPQADSGKKPLTQAERRANAARRRQQEQQAAIDKAVTAAVQAEQQKNEQTMNQFFRDANLKNTITGKPITNMAEFRQWQEAFAQKKAEQAMKSGKMTPEVLNDMISRHPVVQQAQTVIDQHAKEAQRQREAADKARLDAELAQIRELNPAVTTVGDILKLPCADSFRANIKNGMSLYNAYRLADFDRLVASKAEAAKQQALNNARGKDHLSPVGSRGPGAESVPPEQMKIFRLMMPDKTDAQIQAYYNKHKPK